jgi:hypothetical protein
MFQDDIMMYSSLAISIWSGSPHQTIIFLFYNLGYDDSFYISVTAAVVVVVVAVAVLAKKLDLLFLS